MLEIALAEAKSGQILAQPVYDAAGKRLVERGVEINETLLRVLARRGVATISICVGEGATTDPEDDPVVRAKLEEMKERLVIGFREHVENPTMAVLYQATNDFLHDKIVREGSH